MFLRRCDISIRCCDIFYEVAVYMGETRLETGAVLDTAWPTHWFSCQLMELGVMEYGLKTCMDV